MENTLTAEQADERAQTIAALREFANWLEDHPTAKTQITPTGVYDYQTERDRFIEQVRALKAADWEQRVDHQRDFELSRSWGPVTYRLYTRAEYVGEERTVSRPATEWVVSPSFLGEITAPEAVIA